MTTVRRSTVEAKPSPMKRAPAKNASPKPASASKPAASSKPSVEGDGPTPVGGFFRDLFGRGGRHCETTPTPAPKRPFGVLAVTPEEIRQFREIEAQVDKQIKELEHYQLPTYPGDFGGL